MSDNERTVFPAELEAAIAALKDHYPEERAALIPAFHLIQDEFGYLSDEALIRAGEILGVSPARTLGVSSFYTMFRRQEEGRFHVNVCRNLSCHLNGSVNLREHLEKSLGVRAGETTADRIFSLGEVECLGACDEAPVMEIDGEYHFRVTPESADRIIEEYRKRAASTEISGEGGQS